MAEKIDEVKEEPKEDITINMMVTGDVIETAVKSGRNENDVRLMCVTKTVESEYINPVLDDGADLIGENRVQEYCSKLDTLHLDGVEKHIIGHLQTNKIKYIAGKVDMIESVDSIKLAKEIDKGFGKVGAKANILVEVNIGNEDSKSGCDICELEELLLQIAELENINIKGLMTIPPAGGDEKYFAHMQELFYNATQSCSFFADADTLSMGMSGDYAAAVKYGSTIVRIGSGLCGYRNYTV